MHKNFVPPVSIEEFAAYLDGNLTDEGMSRIDSLVSTNPDMEELVDASVTVDEGIEDYLQDEFAYEADMTALEDSDFDLPDLDAYTTNQAETDFPESMDVAHAADAADVTDETTGVDIAYLPEDNGETVDEDLVNLLHQDDETQEPQGFPLDFDEDFL